MQVSENHRIRDELVGHIAWRLLLPALFGLPLLGLWIWLATRQGLATLDGVAAQIAPRHPQQLHAVVPAAAPQEIRPLLDALNGLFGRVEAALEAERRFTADAAHELRTPSPPCRPSSRWRDEPATTTSAGIPLAALQEGLTRLPTWWTRCCNWPASIPNRACRSGAGGPRPLAAAVCAELGPAILAKELEFELVAAPRAPS